MHALHQTHNKARHLHNRDMWQHVTRHMRQHVTTQHSICIFVTCALPLPCCYFWFVAADARAHRNLCVLNTHPSPLAHHMLAIWHYTIGCAWLCMPFCALRMWPKSEATCQQRSMRRNFRFEGLTDWLSTARNTVHITCLR